MTRGPIRWLAVALLAALLAPAQALAAPIPSKARTIPPTPRDADAVTVTDFLARAEVAEALAAAGLSAEDVKDRLARLSDEDLRHLASNLAQIQAAGEEVPEYIWWLAGGLLGVLILAAIF
jgi:hypothetical protein